MTSRSSPLRIHYEPNEYAEQKIRALDECEALLSRAELTALTGAKQPKRMLGWLEAREWAHEPPARRGDIPKVLRAYRDARLSGVSAPRRRAGDYSFMTAGLA